MSLREKLDSDLKQAMRDKNAVARETLRMVIADLKNLVVELRTKANGGPVEVTDEDVLRILQKGVKSRQESIAKYEEGGRPELADKERAEIAVIEQYLPRLMGEDELRAVIRGLVAETGASAKSDLGKVMKALLARYPGQVDGKVAQRLAGEFLS